MTRSVIDLPVHADDRRIARLAALAIGLTLAEAAIPSTIPGVKPGLANIVILLVLLQHGWRAAAWVSALRVLASGVLLGTLLAPCFWLATAGALVSLLVLALAQHLPRRYFDPVSLSVLAAFGHIGGQLALAGWWLLPTEALFKLLPIFAAAALIFGAVNGFIVARLLAASAPDRRQSTPCIPPSPRPLVPPHLRPARAPSRIAPTTTARGSSRRS